MAISPTKDIPHINCTLRDKIEERGTFLLLIDRRNIPLYDVCSYPYYDCGDGRYRLKLNHTQQVAGRGLLLFLLHLVVVHYSN